MMLVMGSKKAPENILQMLKQSDEVLEVREAFQNVAKVTALDLGKHIGCFCNTKRIKYAWNCDLGSSESIKTLEQMHIVE